MRLEAPKNSLPFMGRADGEAVEGGKVAIESPTLAAPRPSLPIKGREF
jgi:hypothetical protein